MIGWPQCVCGLIGSFGCNDFGWNSGSPRFTSRGRSKNVTDGLVGSLRRLLWVGSRPGWHESVFAWRESVGSAAFACAIRRCLRIDGHEEYSRVNGIFLGMGMCRGRHSQCIVNAIVTRSTSSRSSLATGARPTLCAGGSALGFSMLVCWRCGLRWRFRYGLICDA